MDKIALRAALRLRRAGHVRGLEQAGELDRMTRSICAHVTAELPRARILSGYLGAGDEANPSPLLHAASELGLATALPHVSGRDAPMRFLAWAPGDPLIPGPFGLLQPEEDRPELAPDLILTPLLGFDRRMARLGQGAGFYDRAFAALPHARRIGLAWSVQEVAAVPTDPWDIHLHAVATELEWIES
jgi:5-formyltetrahydrofolate cyclo-ligase